MQRRLWATVTVVIALGLFGSACRSSADTATQGAGPTAPAPRPGGTIAFGLEAEPNGLDPTRNAWDPSGLQLAGALYDPMTAVAADGSIRPYLLESYEANADFTTWTLHLRPGVTFHDGTPLDAAALVKDLQTKRDSYVTGPPVSFVADLAAADERTVVVHMKKPWATYPALLAGQGGYVAAPAQHDDPEGQIHPIGTGPFKLDTWTIGRSIDLVRNERYWRKDAKGVALPYLETVTFVPQPDGAGRISALKAGDLDVVQARNATDNQTLDALGDPTVAVTHDQSAAETTFVMFNTDRAPLNDVRVRRAIAYATDKGAMATENGWPADWLADGLFADDSPWYVATDMPGANTTTARDLIAEYTAETGAPVTITLNGAVDQRILQQLAEQWKAVGIQTQVALIDVHDNVIAAVSGNYQVTVFNYFAAADPDVLWHFWHSDSSKPSGEISLNFTRLRDTQIDQALDAGRATLDPTARKAAYAQVQQRFAELVPYVWLNRLDWVVAARTTVHDARNVTLPDGAPAAPYTSGQFRLTETWVGS